MLSIKSMLIASAIPILALCQPPPAAATPFFAWIDPSPYAGQIIGNGQCVTFVQAFARAPRTSEWKQGIPVRGNAIPRGTAIATFRNGRYPDFGTGNHAAFYESQDAEGIWVWDQWRGQPVHRRHIKFLAGGVRPSNDGDAYYVIEQ